MAPHSTLRGSDLLIAVDGGNSKTDVRLVRLDGTEVRRAVGGPFRPQALGVPAAMAVLAGLVRELLAPGDVAGPVRGIAAFLAGADLPEEVETLRTEIEARGWAKEVYVANDTFAVLYAGAGSDRRAGVAVVCGTGINCVAVAPDGRMATYPALGAESGDWGGGGDLGRAALWWAIRAEDGRGPATSLVEAVTSHFGRPRVLDVVLAMHRGEESDRRAAELAPAVFAAAEAGDEVAGLLIDVLGDEIAGMASAAARRLGLEAPAVLIGGSVAAAGHVRLLTRVRERAPGPVTVVTEAPAVGAVRYAAGRWGDAAAREYCDV
ncbi:BadF/BadG/BcrA/BcrD ATPase family protein [Catenulispora yoronensis]|uniref:BadF/BadG/BcrA/BcrD ATPase family protein n=1 Tax=Catenulispora yoronensis TaxID=450799 RepID=A0ABN2V326_9ACTN